MRGDFRNHTAAGLTLAFCLMMIPNSAAAQEASAEPASANASSGGLQDIIVTAEKRSTSIQKTPIAIQAVDGDTLKVAGPADIASLAKTQPSVLFGNANANAQVTIRGIGTDFVLPGFEGRTAIHMDGVYLSSLNGVLGSFYDLERVEIALGPQGDLFGRNATAGAVDIVTKKANPTAGTNGYFQLTGGNYGLFQAQGAIGFAASPTLGLRFAGDLINRGGYGKNLITGKDINDQKSGALRGSLAWRPEGGFKLDLTVDYSREDDANYTATFGGNYNTDLTPAQLTAQVNPAFVTINGVRTPIYGTTPVGGLVGGVISPQSNDIAEDRDGFYKSKAYGIRLGMQYDLSSSLSLRSISGYRYNYHFQEVPTDFTSAKVVTNSVYEKLKSFSQEFQLIGDVGIQHFVIGAYYFQGKNLPLTQIANGYPLASAGIALPQGSYYETLIVGAHLNTYSTAFYIHDEVKLSDALSVTLGGRYTHDKIDEFDIIAAPVAQIGLIPFSGGFNFPIPSFAYLDKRTASYNNFSPRVTVSYKPDNNTLIYATWSKGFKSGGFNAGLDRPPSASRVLPPFKPEKITDYEIGLKRDWFDRRLRTNFAAFYYDYKNLQVQQKDQFALTLINNAASSEIYGLEANIEALVTDQLSLTAAGSLLHAEYKEFCNSDNLRALIPSDAKCAAQGFPAGTQDLSGNKLNRAPSYVFNVGADYKVPVGTGQLTAHVDATFTAKSYFTPFNVETVTAPSHELVNASLSYSSDGGLFGSLWVKNLTDKQVATQSSTSALNTGANVATRLSPPRTFGATVGYKF